MARHMGQRINRLRRDFDERERAGDLDGALAVGEELLQVAQTAGAEELEAEASWQVAAVLLAIPGPGRSERIERAIGLLIRTRELLDRGVNANDRLLRARVLIQLGYALSARLRGDPVINQEQAIVLYRQVLGLITMKDDGHLWAVAQTNLGLNLLEGVHARRPNEPAWERDPEAPERLAQIDAAIDHFHAALKWRSFERDPRDWALDRKSV